MMTSHTQETGLFIFLEKATCVCVEKLARGILLEKLEQGIFFSVSWGWDLKTQEEVKNKKMAILATWELQSGSKTNF